MDLIIRLASPVQTWAKYRVAHTDVAATPIPTKSGVAGLLGACVGVRQYQELLDSFSLRVRVDRTNAACTDLQVAVPPRPGVDTELWHRGASVHAASAAVMQGLSPKPYRAKAINITGGTNKVQYSPRRSFIPNAEFICHLAVDDVFGEQLIDGFKCPVFSPYLGRMANPACFPFFLGQWSHDGDVLAAIPHVTRHDDRDDTEPRRLRVHSIVGTYLTHDSSVELVEPPIVDSRDVQLAWMKENLTR